MKKKYLNDSVIQKKSVYLCRVFIHVFWKSDIDAGGSFLSR